MKATSWLWPDRTIGKREARTLREEHNALVNDHARLTAALDNLENAASRVTADINDQNTGWFYHLTSSAERARKALRT